MKLHHDQLAIHLQRQLAAVYVIAGEEILFLQEAQNAVYAAAVKAGFSERIRFNVEAGFDWLQFQQASQNASLFSDKQYLELNISGGKISDAGKKILLDYLQRPPAGKILVIRTGKLDAATQKTTWYKAADKAGVVIPIWPLSAAQMPGWIQRRLQSAGFQADAAAVQLLAMRTEGNLLAAAQEIEKLGLLYPKGRLTLPQMEEASHNSARYHVFGLVDVILQSDPRAIIRVLAGLQQEAVEPTLVLWALAREARQWSQWLQALQNGQTLTQLMGGNYLLEKKQPLIARTLQRHSLTTLYRCVQQAAVIDTLIKGAAVGTVWDELRVLALALAGVNFL